MRFEQRRARAGGLLAVLALAATAAAQTPCQGGSACGGGPTATISFSDSAPPLPPPWDRPLSVPSFDVSLGQLAQVELRATLPMSGFFAVENTDPFQGCPGGLWSLEANVDLRSTDGAIVLLDSETISAGVSFGPLASYDGVLDFGGTSGETHPFQQSVTVDLCLDDAGTLALFGADVAGATVDFTADSVPTNSTTTHVCGELIVGWSVLLGIELEVTYTYCPAVGQSFCSGDGSAASCPCGNGGSAGHGCASSSSASGARLSATGLASLAGDTLTLRVASSVPGQPGLFCQGDDRILGGDGAPFGDGLRCVGGNIKRLQVVTADAAGAAASTVAIGASGGAAPGDVKRYQWWYRDPVGGPCGTGFNLSNGLEFAWMP